MKTLWTAILFSLMIQSLFDLIQGYGQVLGLSSSRGRICYLNIKKEEGIATLPVSRSTKHARLAVTPRSVGCPAHSPASGDTIKLPSESQGMHSCSSYWSKS